jgi:integrase
MCTYLVRRGATYYFRRVIPADLRPAFKGKREFMVSLRVTNREAAKALVPDRTNETNRLLDAARVKLGGLPVPVNDSEQSISSIALDLGMVHESQPDHEFPDVPDPMAIAQSELREAIETPVFLEQLKAEEKRGRRQQGKLLDTDIVDLWAAERKVQSQGVSMYRAAARWLYERTGRKPVDMIARADILAFKDALLAEGHSASNIKNKLARLRTLLKYAKDNGHASINAAEGVVIADKEKAKNKRRSFDLASLNALFGSSLYTDRTIPTDKRAGGEAAYWLPLLALFTGARREELGQLRPSDVQQLSYPDAEGNEQSAWFLRLIEDEGEDGTKLKNAASERLVPVHPELERLGFLTYVEKQKGEPRLFPNLKANKYGRLTDKWGQWFTLYRRSVGITDKRQVFHSFRHTFTDYARHAAIPEGVTRQLVGHSGEDVHDDYGSGYSLHRLVEGMKLYRIPGLSLGI